MIWVKVCGITSNEALSAAVEAGADALGFVLAPGSPRTIEPETAAAYIDGLHVDSFLVLVDATPTEALAAVSETGATGLQAHGKYSDAVAEMAISEGLKALRPVPVSPAGPAIDPSTVAIGAIPLLDTADDKAHGGTGRTFPWSAIGVFDRDFVLAGGLGPGNVAQAVRQVRPYGVDASSGLESSPGVKDPDSIRAFVETARQA